MMSETTPLYDVGTEEIEEVGTVVPAPSVSASNGHAPGGRRVLTRAAILAAPDLETEWVPVREWAPKGDPHPEEWGVYVRGLTAGQRGALEGSTLDKKGKPDPQRLAEFRARMLMSCVVDDAGQPLFGRNDLAVLMNRSAVAAERVLEVSRRLSGMTEEDEDDLLGNDDPGQPGDSSTG